MSKPRLQQCRLAKQHHRASCRQFAHVFHKPNVICLAPEFADLPAAYQAGILLHEFGHLTYREDERHTEKDADTMAYVLSGVRIQREDFLSDQGLARNLEYVAPPYLSAAIRFITENATASRAVWSNYKSR